MTAIQLIPLGELCEVNIGRTPSRAQAEYWGVGHPWLSIADMNQGRELSATKEQITARAVNDAGMKAVPKGTILMSFKLSIGKVGISSRTMFTNEAIAALPIKEPARLLPSYLYWALQAADLDASQDRAAMGATLNKAKLLSLKVPLHVDLQEQRRLADILDQAEALRSQRRAAIAQLDSLGQAIFVEMFGDPLTNPKRWPTTPLHELGTVLTGNTPSRADNSYYGEAIEWIKSDNINTPDYYLTRATESLSDAGRKVGRIAPVGAVLVTCIAGSPDCIGNAGMADREVAFNQQINAFIPGSINSHFVYQQFVVGKKMIQAASTNGMKGMVSKSRFEQIEMFNPPLRLQQDFEGRILAVQRLRTHHASAKAHLDALFASLQHRAFRGELSSA